MTEDEARRNEDRDPYTGLLGMALIGVLIAFSGAIAGAWIMALVGLAIAVFFIAVEVCA